MTLIPSGPSDLDNAVLVVAHPDDEILWFSSIAADVDEIVIVFRDSPWDEVLSEGRRRALNAFPLATMCCLEITEPAVFNQAAWPLPRETDHGLALAAPAGTQTRYRRAFDEARAALRPKLVGRQHVYTHNPWGEYGHEEHVLLHRAVVSLQAELGFQLWYDNYASQHSAALLGQHLAGRSGRAVTRRTNIALAHQLRDLYLKHQCWTWDAEFVWFADECFIAADSLEVRSAGGVTWLCPINFFYLPLPPKVTPLQRLRFKAQAMLKRL